MPSDDKCRQCSTGRCMGARRRRRDTTTTTTFDTMSWQQWSLMGEFKEGGWSQIEGQVSGGQEGGSNSSSRSSRVRRAAGTSNSWTTEDPHTKAVLTGIQAGSNEGNQGKDVSPEAVDWGRGQYKHSGAGKVKGDWRVGGAGWPCEEQKHIMRDANKLEQVTHNAGSAGVVRWPEEGWGQRRRGANEQNDTNAFPTLATKVGAPGSLVTNLSQNLSPNLLTNIVNHQIL